MKARLIRFAFALHRWMGVTLDLLMLVWRLSGFVLIWRPIHRTRWDRATIGSKAWHTFNVMRSPIREVVRNSASPQCAGSGRGSV